MHALFSFTFPRSLCSFYLYYGSVRVYVYLKVSNLPQNIAMGKAVISLSCLSNCDFCFILFSFYFFYFFPCHFNFFCLFFILSASPVSSQATTASFASSASSASAVSSSSSSSSSSSQPPSSYIEIRASREANRESYLGIWESTPLPDLTFRFQRNFLAFFSLSFIAFFMAFLSARRFASLYPFFYSFALKMN
jgi:hypothetical protein